MWLPGVLVAVAAALLAGLVHALVPGIPLLTAAVVLGIVVGQLPFARRYLTGVLAPGLGVASHRRGHAACQVDDRLRGEPAQRREAPAQHRRHRRQRDLRLAFGQPWRGRPLRPAQRRVDAGRARRPGLDDE